MVGEKWCQAFLTRWYWSKLVVRLTAQGLDSPPAGKPWWWPRWSVYLMFYYLWALSSETGFGTLVLVYAVAISGIMLQLQWGKHKINRDYGLTDIVDYRETVFYLGLGFFSAGIVIYRLMGLLGQPNSGLVETFQDVQGIDVQYWVVVAAVGLTVAAVLLMIQKTNELMATFGRQDTLVLRLPVRRDEVEKVRFRQWVRLMALPVLGLCVLDVAVLLLNNQSEHGLAWVGWLVAVQAIVVSMGSFLFFFLTTPEPRWSENHGV